MLLRTNLRLATTAVDMPSDAVVRSVLAFVTVLTSASALAGNTPYQGVQATLDQAIASNDAIAFKLQRYLFRGIPKPPTPTTSGDWLFESQRLRRHLLYDVAFHGWPQEWVTANANFKELSVIEAGRERARRARRHSGGNSRLRSLESNLTHPRDSDEVEENATDFAAGQDFTHFAAMRSPHLTLLIHNAEDDC